MPLQPLSVGVFRFDLTVTDEIELSPYKGFAIRGVFGTVLRYMACIIPGIPCHRCPIKRTCTYSYLFETPPLEGVDGFRRFKDASRPYIIYPPLGRKLKYSLYDTMHFEFALIGSGRERIDDVVKTFEEIGRLGIRDGKGKFLIDRVTVLGDAGQEQLIYSKGKISGASIPFRTISLQQGELGDSTSVTLLFNTPLLLEERGEIQFKSPQFGFLFENLVRRILLLQSLHGTGVASVAPQLSDDLVIMLLQALHGSGGTEIDQVKKLLKQACEVVIEKTDMQWMPLERRSSKQKQQGRIKTGGLIGSITYAGDITPFIPYLQLGELIHIGKSTTFGFGGYKLSIG